MQAYKNDLIHVFGIDTVENYESVMDVFNKTFDPESPHRLHMFFKHMLRMQVQSMTDRDVLQVVVTLLPFATCYRLKVKQAIYDTSQELCARTEFLEQSTSLIADLGFDFNTSTRETLRKFQGREEFLAIIKHNDDLA